MTDTDLTCKCGRPTREGRSFCETCADDLAYALGEIPWLEEQLEITTTRSKGVDYRTRGGTPSGERPSPVVWSASDARINLRGFLIAWVRYCHDNDIRNSSPVHGMPAGDMPTLTALSRYLMWRVDGLALSDRGAAAVEQITAAVAKGKRLIDRPADKWFAGPCDECRVDMYAKVGAREITCRSCSLTYDVAERREWFLKAARDHHATAGEIARAVAVWGDAGVGESKLVKRIDTWRSRGRITVTGHIPVRGIERPLFSVGDVLRLLEEDATRRHESARSTS